MNQGKASGWTGRGEPVVDRAQIVQALGELLSQEVEFPLKVEGTHTLPYTARVVHLDAPKGLLHVKLIRPLPHELAEGAAFQMLFATGDQRFEAPSTYKGREGYLLYRFTIPPLMAPSDRRKHKRYPFRPREKAYVVAQDATVPGHGISGPLVNLSLGGLALRVDRIMRLDDHLRITPGLGFFDRGKSFPMLKIRDLPNLPLFDARGTLAFAEERGNEIIVGIQFGELKESELAELQSVLTIRENMKRVAPLQAGEGSRTSGPRAPASPEAESEAPMRVRPAGQLTPDALRRLGRRCTRLVVAMPPGPDREGVARMLREGGYLRLEWADDSARGLALASTRGQGEALLLVASHAPVRDTEADLRRQLAQNPESRTLAVALLCRETPLPELEDPDLRALPWPTAEGQAWRSALDELAGLEA